MLNTFLYIKKHLAQILYLFSCRESIINKSDNESREIPMISNSSTTLRKENLDGFEIHITQNNHDQTFHLSAINTQTGESYGPKRIYEGVKKTMVEKNLSDQILIHEVTDNSISLTIPIIEENVRLEKNNVENKDAKINLLQHRVDELSNEVKTLREEMKMFNRRTFYGKTKPSDWKVYCDNGIYVEVNISHLGLQTTPHIQTSLHGNNNNWGTTGGSSIDEASKDSFAVYVRHSDSRKLKPQEAQAWNWHIHYTVTSFD